MNPAEPEILTPEQVASLLKVRPSWVYEKVRRRSRNPLPVHRVGRYLRFRRSAVLAWFDGTASTAPVHKNVHKNVHKKMRGRR